jgi:hypothetical protein
MFLCAVLAGFIARPQAGSNRRVLFSAHYNADQKHVSTHTKIVDLRKPEAM